MYQKLSEEEKLGGVGAPTSHLLPHPKYLCVLTFGTACFVEGIPRSATTCFSNPTMHNKGIH